MTIRTVLALTDLTAHADDILTQAASVAEAFDATLHVLHVADESSEDEAAAELDERLERVPFDASQVRVHIRPSDDVTGVARSYVREHGADLIVMGTHSRGGIARLVFGSTSETLMHRAPCPIMTLGTHVKASTDVQSILTPVDFSESSEHAARQAHRLARHYQARHDLLFVVERHIVPSFNDTGIPGIGVKDMGKELADNAEAALRALISQEDRSDQIATHVRRGSVAATITEAAEELESDLIVMAARGLSEDERVKLGSVTERVMRSAPCPVLVWPAPVPDEAEQRAAEGHTAREQEGA